MNPRRLELALKKQRLCLHGDALRQQFAAAASEWRPACSVVDRLCQGVDWLRQHPPLWVALLVAVIVARPRRSLKLAGRAWALWRVLRRMKVLGVGIGTDRQVGTASGQSSGF